MARRFQTQDEQEKLREVKLKLCVALRRSMGRKFFSHKEVAEELGTSNACVTHLIHRDIDKLTINQLFAYLARLQPDFDILISV